jgi:Zn-finger nucleic acid-binding protein
MEVEDLEVIELELKYCERCGGLWLRLRGAQEVFCAPCVVKTGELPISRKRKNWQRLPANHKTEIRGECIELTAIYLEGGNA